MLNVILCSPSQLRPRRQQWGLEHLGSVYVDLSNKDT